MGPTMALRLVNKRLPKSSGQCPDKDANTSSKSKKRKLSDMLDSQWSKVELRRFYDAFRRYDKNWKKLAGAVHSKSVNMVEKLYNENRAYLSLPEGAANADGLIANMTDRYSNLDASDNDKEIKDALKKIHKPLECERGKVRLETSKRSDGPHLAHLRNQSACSSNKGMPSSKKYSGVSDLSSCLVRWPAGKRTPRVPVICDPDVGNHFNSPHNLSLKRNESASPGEGFHVAATTLFEASQGSHSTFVCQKPRRADLCISSGVERVIGKHADVDTTNPYYVGAGLGNHLKDTVGRMEANKVLSGSDIQRQDVNCLGETQPKMKRVQVKRSQLLGIKSFHFDDAQEVSTCEEEALNTKALEDEADMEVPKQNTDLDSQDKRKKSRKPLLEDESSALDPLQMLADVTLNFMLKRSALESVQGVHGTEQTGEGDSSYGSDFPGTKYVNLERKNFEISVHDERRHSSFAMHKSGLSGSMSAHCGSDDTEILFQGDRWLSSDIAYKLHVPDLLGNAALDGPNFLAKEHTLSAVETDATSLEAPKQRKDMCPCGTSEMNQRNCPAISKMQHIEQNCLAETKRDLKEQGGAYNLYTNYSIKKQDGCLTEQKMGNSKKLSNTQEAENERGGSIISNEYVSIASGISHGSVVKYPGILPVQHTKAKEAEDEDVVSAQLTMSSQDHMLANIKRRDAYIKAIVKLSSALDKKEAVLKELKWINDNFSIRPKDGDLITEFIKQYGVVLKLFDDVREQATSALSNLKLHSTYKNSTSTWSSMDYSAEPGRSPGFPSAESLASQDSNSHVTKVLASSRKKARKMVDATLLAISAKDEVEGAEMRIRGALNSSENQQSAVVYNNRGTGYSCLRLEQGKSAYKYEAVSCMSEPVTTVHAPNPGAVSSANDSSSISELISSCIATFFMIQDTSESRYPPAEAVAILEHAVRSLKPRCSQNLSIYNDIEKCMGVIKTQMLTLLPSPTKIV